MIVVNTNVIAYLMIEGEKTGLAPSYSNPRILIGSS